MYFVLLISWDLTVWYGTVTSCHGIDMGQKKESHEQAYLNLSSRSRTIKLTNGKHRLNSLAAKTSPSVE